jgi:chloride channel 7
MAFPFSILSVELFWHVGIHLPLILSTPDPQTTSVCMQPIRFHCPEGQHNDLATSFFSTDDQLLGRLFSVGQDYQGHTQGAVTPGFTMRSLVIFCLIYLVMMALASGICVPAGLFMPSIILGASGGLTVGLLLQEYLPPHWHIQPGAYAWLCGRSLREGRCVHAP